jgi:dihydrofolate reductase
MSISLDGFVAGPNGEIDWMFPSRSEDAADYLVEKSWETSLIIMGRRSYEEMAGFWPTSTLPFAGPMNAIPKMIFSRSGELQKAPGATAATSDEMDAETQRFAEILEMWRNPQVGGKDLAADINLLKESDGKPIGALGGASFAASLIELGLVDEFHLVVHPVVLGKGLAIFEKLSKPLYMHLVETRTFSKGGMLKVFQPQKTS